jgi:DNA-binding NarL/FixJ family response regulator
MARRDHPLRVIVLTTFTLDDRAAAAIRLGASGFLLKDATPAMLLDAIRTVHTGNAVLAPRDLAALLDGNFRPLARPAEYETLTDKERDVFTADSRGLSNAEIGDRLFLSESTVKTHVGSILRKLRLRDRVQLVVYAHDHDHDLS